MTLASCIGCGCDDLHACVDDLGPCSWIVVDRDTGRGVCSCCEAHMERWNAGDRSVLMLVAKITRDSETEPYFIEKNGMGSFPYFLEVEAGDKFSLEWVEMSQEQFEALPAAIRARTPGGKVARRNHRCRRRRIRRENG